MEGIGAARMPSGKGIAGDSGEPGRPPEVASGGGENNWEAENRIHRRRMTRMWTRRPEGISTIGGVGFGRDSGGGSEMGSSDWEEAKSEVELAEEASHDQSAFIREVGRD